MKKIFILCIYATLLLVSCKKELATLDYRFTPSLILNEDVLMEENAVMTVLKGVPLSVTIKNSDNLENHDYSIEHKILSGNGELLVKGVKPNEKPKTRHNFHNDGDYQFLFTPLDGGECVIESIINNGVVTKVVNLALNVHKFPLDVRTTVLDSLTTFVKNDIYIKVTEEEYEGDFEAIYTIEGGEGYILYKDEKLPSHIGFKLPKGTSNLKFIATTTGNINLKLSLSDPFGQTVTKNHEITIKPFDISFRINLYSNGVKHYYNTNKNYWSYHYSPFIVEARITSSPAVPADLEIPVRIGFTQTNVVGVLNNSVGNRDRELDHKVVEEDRLNELVFKFKKGETTGSVETLVKFTSSFGMELYTSTGYNSSWYFKKSGSSIIKTTGKLSSDLIGYKLWDDIGFRPQLTENTDNTIHVNNNTFTSYQ